MVFFLTLCLGLLAMTCAVAVGRRLGLVVKPRLFGQSERVITHLGGPALALVAVGTYLTFHAPDREVWVLLGGGLVVLVLGFVDDLFSARNGIHPLARLVVEVLVAAGMWIGGIQAFNIGPWWVGAAMTTVFLVGAMNAWNLLDNMDGVAGMSSVVGAGGIVAIALMTGANTLAVLGACIGGAAAAFLFFNLVRPRVYLGDAGSLFLGLIIGGAALQLDTGLAPPGNFLVGLVILGVAFTDTGSRQFSRWLAGRSPFDILGGTDHLSHRLVKLGFTSIETAVLHGAAGLFAVACAGIAVVNNTMTPLVGALVAACCAGLGFVAISRSWMIAEPETAHLPGSAAVDPEPLGSQLVTRLSDWCVLLISRSPYRSP